MAVINFLDYHLILEELHRRNHPPKRICTTGLKIYSMRLGGNHQRRIIFKDSLNYFFCELDALPKTFGLPPDGDAVAKPFFPYLWIQHQNLHTRVPGLPPIEHYQKDHMFVHPPSIAPNVHQFSGRQKSEHASYNGMISR